MSPSNSELIAILLTTAIRPSFGTATIPNEPTSAIFDNPAALAIAPASIPLLLTTMADDGAFIGTNYPLDPGTAQGVLYGLLGGNRMVALMGRATYGIPNGMTDARPFVASIFTDGAWRCPTREIARKWAGAGGKVYVGEFREGSHYPLNDDYTYCAGKVCHSVSWCELVQQGRSS